VTVTAFMLLVSGGLSPWLVALMRRHSWSDDTVQVVALVVSAACYILGQWGDGLLAWPLSGDFLVGLAAAFGLNQGGYYLTKRVAPNAMDKVEKL
jgi:uncharacterized membrane protein YiaA